MWDARRHNDTCVCEEISCGQTRLSELSMEKERLYYDACKGYTGLPVTKLLLNLIENENSLEHYLLFQHPFEVIPASVIRHLHANMVLTM